MYTLLQSRRLVDTPESTTPIWMLGKNCGVTTEEIARILRAHGLEIVVDDDLKPAIRKADLLKHIGGSYVAG